MAHFSWLCLLPIYFSSRILKPLLSLFLLCLCVLSSPLLLLHISPFLSTSPFLPFHLFPLCSFPRLLNMCGKNRALGLHSLFHVRTSGDIKGLLRGLSLCISPSSRCLLRAEYAPTSLLYLSLLKRLVQKTTRLNPPGCNCAYVHAHADSLSPHTERFEADQCLKA